MTDEPKRIGRASIYGLLDPSTGELRYIGKANDPAARLRSHMREVRRRTPLYCWIGTLSQPPRLVILHDCSTASLGTSGADWRVMEKSAIKLARDAGFRLLNLAEGGDEPYCPPATRASNGPKAVAARTRSPQAERLWRFKRMIGDNLRRGYVSEETKVKLRAKAKRDPENWGAFATI